MPIPGLVDTPEGSCTGSCGSGCPCFREAPQEAVASSLGRETAATAFRCGASFSTETAPILVLAIGNPLMADDGAGQEILTQLESTASEWGANVEFVDGGTQGLALLGQFEKRKAVVFLDAVRLGFQPGSVHVLSGDELLRMGGRSTSAHEGSAPDILRALELLGETPSEVTLVGVEPERIETSIGLSPAVRNSIGLAAELARTEVNRLVSGAGH